ncbi:MAG TPA: hypothetical protein VKA46_35340 [Gemmataceae bacterium]|nr:hypothetical protein [Gemmataceae bacterium]
MKKAPRTFVVLFLALFVAVLLDSPSRAAPPPAPVFAAGSTSRAFWAPIEWALGTQRRMLQVATVGMCLAIYIIVWRK